MAGTAARQSAEANPAPRAPEPGRSHDRRRVQTALKLSDPGDAAEREAVATARAVMQMRDPVVAPQARVPMLAARAPAAVPAPSKAKKDEVSPELTAEIKSLAGSGKPLSPDTRSFLEPRFKANFAGVRVHTGGKAENLATRLGARAFTFGKDIFFNAGAYKPDSPEGMELIAHELTHTIQQREVVQREVIQREEAVTVQQRSEPQVQRGIVSEALDWIADKANVIPGFRLFTIIIGRNPINMSKVDRSGANILRALIEFIPGGGLIVQALENHGIFEKGGKFIEEQFAALADLGGAVRDALMEFIDSLGWRDIFRLGSLWDRAKRIFTTPIDKAITFGKGLVTGIATLVKDAIIKPLGRWAAANIPKWDLLVGVFGKNPISDEGESPASALIGGFMELIGQKEIWENIKKGNAVAKAWAWFQGAMKGALSLVTSIPGRVMSTIRSLTIFDIVTLVGAFQKIIGAFASFVGDFMRWAGGTVLQLLEIILSVVAPTVIPYLKKAGGAFSTIIKNPIGFVRTLVRAGIQGFRQFARNFLAHLKAALIGWLTGSLGGLGIYIPSGFTLIEILKFVLSVMGLTWANVRAKLVAATNETVVKALETGFDIVKTLVTEGPAAAWQKIVETLTNLKQMAIDAVMDFVKSKVVEAAVTKLLSMLSPAGAFIQAIIAIYNTIMFFVERIRQIAQVAAAFIDGIAAIAAGNIAPAANKVEQTMAGLLVLVISFLARIAGLGKVSDAITGLVKKIRAPIDKALDKVVAWIVATAKSLGKMAKQGVSMLVDWWKEKLGFTNKDGESHTLQFIGGDDNAKMGIATTLQPVRTYLDNHPDKGSAEWNTANSIFTAAMQVIYSPALKTQAEKDRRAAIKAQLAKVSAAFAKLAGDPPKDNEYGTNSDPSYGNPAKVDIIVGDPKSGSITGPWPVTKKGYKEIYDAGLTTATDRWVQMHIISEKIGGSGSDFGNLVPAPNSVNTGPFRSFEHAIPGLARAKSGKIKNRVWVEVSISGSKTAATGISGKAGLYLWKGRKPKPTWIKSEAASLSASAGIPVPQLTAARKLVVNFTSATEMTRDFGISSGAAALCKQGRPYGSMAAFSTSMLARGATAAQVAAFITRGAVLNGP
ncbi:hypothetical protein FHS95_000443 [Sphingomonas naasensis]|uniref:DUF4157 domain-containing protein n=1 Tax=Sphingomonas naasensis TaxID=1344951 RepID=A0A4S1WUI5_9SPHN|nr:DUF4157 domain-containing protein [Sphingomonas naasensis]NIJ18774.1 hypothetical protein [Sphingomonas naasensis]TGX46007.1 DUF4157 domain-containing protein [Sphingomonas naasensis]